MTRRGALLGAFALMALPACRRGRPLVDTTPDDETTPGTIAGILSDTGGEPVADRRVHAVSTTNGRRYSAVTNVTGGFSIPVPPGKYRMQVDLREGERVVKEPGVVDINESDLDANREIVIGGS